MKRILLIIVFSTISYVSTAQLELILSLFQQVDIGRLNEVKNGLLSGQMVTIQVAEIVDRTKGFKADQYKGFEYLEAPDFYIIPFDPSTGLVLNLRK